MLVFAQSMHYNVLYMLNNVCALRFTDSSMYVKALYLHVIDCAMHNTDEAV
ncbi:MAG: hypothetical protein ABI855_03090 [Bacteroidota bacterium]